MLRITLNNEFLGPQETMEVIGINEIVQNIKRDEVADGVFFSLVLNLQFIKAERSYIQQAFELYGGPDAQVTVLIELENPNTTKFETYFIGTIDFSLYTLEEDKVAVNIIHGIGFQEKILNGIEKSINLETLVSEDGATLPSMLVIEDLSLHSKTIKREFETIVKNAIYLDGGATNPELDAGQYYSPIQNSVIVKNDFPDGSLPNYPVYIYGATSDPIIDGLYYYRAKYSGEHRFNFDLRYIFGTSGGSAHSAFMRFVCIKRSGNVGTVLFGSTPLYDDEHINPTYGLPEMHDPRSITVNLLEGDLIYLFPEFNLDETQFIEFSTNTGSIFGLGDSLYTTITIDADTSFAPSTCKVVLLFEAVKKCLQYLTGQSDCLKSDLLGRTDLGYAVDGDGALIAITNGKLIRKIDVPGITRSEDLYCNLKYLLDFINAVYCIGWGFEIIDGVLKFVVEKKSYWYNKNQEVISLGRVANIKSKINLAAYFNTFIYGYSTKMENNEINSIDEFNTLREDSIPIINTKNKLNVSTEMKVSGYQIEQQRRLVNSSEDSKLDDENFAIVVIRDGGGFKSKKDEGYTSILNVFDSATGYNYDISPARCKQNWLPFIASLLTRSTNKTIKFSSGQTNFLMATKKTGELNYTYENGDVDLTNIEPLYDTLVYQFGDFPFSKDQVELIKLNPKGYWSFQDRFGFTMKGFLNSKGLEHDSNLGKATNVELIKLV